MLQHFLSSLITFTNIQVNYKRIVWACDLYKTSARMIHVGAQQLFSHEKLKHKRKIRLKKIWLMWCKRWNLSRRWIRCALLNWTHRCSPHHLSLHLLCTQTGTPAETGRTSGRQQKDLENQMGWASDEAYHRWKAHWRHMNQILLYIIKKNVM